MKCTICTSPYRAAVIEHWARIGSLRKTAERFGVGYRSLHRHFDKCVARIMVEASDKRFKEELAENIEYLRDFYRKPRRKKRRSIITKPVQFTWSRRSWGSNDGKTR